jgi:TrmH family RNA methyltransferase
VAIITSKSNPKTKQARALRQRKERDESGLFLVEGLAHVGAAIESNAAIDYILYSPELLISDFGKQAIAQAEQKKIECLETSADVFESVADKEHPSGLLAVAHKSNANLESLILQPQSLFVALVTPQDPGNIGAILRTLDAVNASGLILLEGGADPYHPNAVRASMGALFYKSVVTASFAECVQWAKQNGCAIVGTSAKATTDYRATNYKLPLVLLMGSEQKGLTAEQSSACDHLIRLPMEGKVSSLNLAVATGILLYAIKATL